MRGLKFAYPFGTCGFGSFKVRHYKGYTGRNPRNSQAIEVPPKRLPVFKPSRLMEARLNASLKG